MEAISLVQDWIQSVGSIAGLHQDNTNLHSGAVGAAESRLEVKRWQHIALHIMSCLFFKRPKTYYFGCMTV